jgi:uncharacterized protein (DUF488 family)
VSPSRVVSLSPVVSRPRPARAGPARVRAPVPPAARGAACHCGVVTLLTFGHGTAAAERCVELLAGAGVGSVVDIRIAPGSRRNPQFARAELERWLPEAGIAYRWEKRLGGFRRPSPDNPDVVWREDMFRGYAEYMRTEPFQAAIDLLLQEDRSAVMCSESVWWRCHRRLVADFVTAARGVPVRHLMHDGRVQEHQPSPGLRLRPDGLLVYDGGQAPQL